MTLLEDKISFFDDLADLLHTYSVSIQQSQDELQIIFDNEVSETWDSQEEINTYSLRERIENLEGYGVT